MSGGTVVILGQTGRMSALKALVESHHQYTDSKRAEELLANWPLSQTHFVKLISKEYKQLTQGTGK